MKAMGEMLLRRSSFSEIVMGNTSLVRAMVEAGTRVVTSYPGSPTPEIAVAIQSIPREKRPFYFEFSTNEKVATEVSYGAAVNGHLSTVFFKSVGLNVASDTFVQISMMNIIGGMIIVLGDDPGANSSQNEQDNRHMCQMCYTPVFEPANPSEVYVFYLEAAKLSREKKMPVVLRMTTHVCHAKEKVHFGPYFPEVCDNTSRFSPENGPYIPLTSEVFPKKRRALQNLSEIESYKGASRLIQKIDNNNSNRGIITTGLPFLSLMDTLRSSSNPPDILKLGIVYPVIKSPIAKFLSEHKEVKVLEELDNVIEKEIKAFAFDEKIPVKIIGKEQPEEWLGEYTPDKVYDIIIKTWPDVLPEKNRNEQKFPPVTPRPAQMCPGCGHRSAFYAIKKALSKTDISVADIGCHTLGYLPPYEVGQLLMCMGASTGIGSGLSLFNDKRRVVAFMGDSTFFHAGLPGIINAVYNQHDITMIIMENGTTAMTGHQDHAGSGKTVNGPSIKIPIRGLLECLGIKNIWDVDTYNQSKLTDYVKKAIKMPGFNVVIARHPCMLKFMRDQRKKGGITPRKISIDQNICQRIYECVERFACPTFSRKDDGSIAINEDLCIGDGSCIQSCPASAVTYPKS